MANESLPEKAIKDLKLDALAQMEWNEELVSPVPVYGNKIDNIKYESCRKEIDPYVARLAGCDHNFAVERKNLDSAVMNGKIPELANYYFLGKRLSHEEVYSCTDQTDSRDYIPIVFLRNIDAC